MDNGTLDVENMPKKVKRDNDDIKPGNSLWNDGLDTNTIISFITLKNGGK